MSSTNKTQHYELNNWLGSDVPQRADFNADNEAIDSALYEHETDEVSHITATERNTWNSQYYIGVYYGNDAATRTVVTNCPFEPTFGFVFALNFPLGRVDFTNKFHYNYSAFITDAGGTFGAEFNGANIVVQTTTTAASWNEIKSLNVSGTTYAYTLFR